jgi:hypothetical protein
LKKFLAGVFVLMFMVSGCGLVEKTTTVTKTVTATPSPIITAEPTIAAPYFSETDIAGIIAIEGFFVELKHINATIAKTLAYGGRTGNAVGVMKRVEHFSSDWKVLRNIYSSSNGGEPYSGKVTRLEDLFEDASSHVQKFGLGLLRIITNGNDSSIMNCAMQQIRAERSLAAVEKELSRLETLMGESY